MVCRRAWLRFFSFLLAISSVTTYEVPISHTDYDRQTCSGMWTSENTYINGISQPLHIYHRRLVGFSVTFDAKSQGQLASVIYEWEDVKYLGKNASRDGDLPVSTTYSLALRSPTVHTLNALYTAVEDLYLHTRRYKGRTLRHHPGRTVHYRPAKREAHQRYQLLDSTSELL